MSLYSTCDFNTANELLGETPTRTHAIAQEHPEMPTGQTGIVELRHYPDS